MPTFDLSKARWQFRDSPSPRTCSDPVGGSVRIRKEQYPFGWDWGPRFVTAGIWRTIRLETRSANRLAHIRISQTHTDSGRHVSLTLSPELARADQNVTYWVTLSLDGRPVVESDILSFDITSPRLWWPAGQGQQPLYDLTINARDNAGRDLGTITHRLGMRTIVLDRHPDPSGESLQFIINNRPVFIKSANWIPVDSFVARLDRAANA